VQPRADLHHTENQNAQHSTTIRGGQLQWIPNWQLSSDAGISIGAAKHFSVVHTFGEKPWP
jgi:hypothetical protein